MDSKLFPEPFAEMPAPRKGLDPEALTRALRIAGAALVVASASTFMLQHWQGGNDVTRYAMLVGQSMLLAAAAYFVGLTVREGRSARTFLALVLGTIPVSFTVLGGLVYSRFHLEALSPLPHYASWVAPNDGSVVLAVVGTLIVLVPLAIVSMVALARKEAKALTLVFTGANLLLLLPIRAPVPIVAIAGALLVALLELDRVRFARAPRLDTLEGKLARVMPFFPPLIMLGRVVHLYDISSAFAGGCLLTLAAGLFQFAARTKHPQGRQVLGWFSAGIAVHGWGLCWLEVLPHLHGAALTVLLLGVPASALVLIASLRADAARGPIASVGTIFALGTVVLAAALDRATGPALCAIVLGTIVGVVGAGFGSWAWALIGAGVALFGLGVEVWQAVHVNNLVRWASLSLVGVGMIVGSAYVERHRALVARGWDSFTRRLPRIGA
jgi:hypothetical protein